MYILGLLCLFSSYGEKFLIFIKIIMWPNIKISMFLLPFKHIIKVNLILYKHNFKIPYIVKCRQRDEWKNEQTNRHITLARVCVLATQSCLTLCDPTDGGPPSFSVYGTLQARTLEWIAILFSRGTSQPRDQMLVSHTAGRFFTVWATGKSWKDSQHWDSSLCPQRDCSLNPAP